ncbi:DUF4326 domain-containing protein [Afifella sp. IM 167]|uniref:DUF4326 domain-containing protein n=1 Tax=Afifella sp. IM 167 TaxID=2033586 RepID=UPI001CC8FEAF|nr:DUF4326 domain-containing protein [Afifella sp. IM 167]MBZ8133255.1 hypothetical protein [Afifella sp. IM 167]
MTAPRRIQRRREKGFRLGDAVYVGRPTRWGNPCRLDDGGVPVSPEGAPLVACIETDKGAFRSIETFCGPRRLERDDTVRRAQLAAGFRAWIARPEQAWLRAAARAELAGRDLACWCPEGQPCHGDVLLEIANGGE